MQGPVGGRPGSPGSISNSPGLQQQQQQPLWAGPVWAGRLWAPWPCGPPWALVGSPWPLWAGPLCPWALVHWAFVGPLGPFVGPALVGPPGP